jgi:RHS repeat-associated protein
MQRYASMERDDTTGLDHTWWRKLENSSGRWTSPDPYHGSMAGRRPQSFNRYSYVENDPINLVDPSGLTCYVKIEIVDTIAGGKVINRTAQIIGFHCDGATPTSGPEKDRQDRLKAALLELIKRLNERQACRDLFGGLEKAVKALNDTNFQFQDLGGPYFYGKGTPYPTIFFKGIDGATKGKNIIINSRGRFMAQDGTIPYVNEPNDKMYDVNLFGLEDVESAAFILLHELGHRRGIFGKDDNDGIDDKNGTAEEKNKRNSKKVLDACFND